MPVGHCIQCDKAINRAANLTEYKGFTYHTNCFVCNICTKNITGPKGFINDPADAKKHYCHECYEENVAPRCDKCSKAIVGGERGVKHRSKPFHKKCFTCDGCSTELADVRFSVENEKPFCTDCHLEKFAERCSLVSCKKPIPPGTQFLVVDADKFHKDCFNCSGCEKNLADEAFVKDPEGNFCAVCAES